MGIRELISQLRRAESLGFADDAGKIDDINALFNEASDAGKVDDLSEIMPPLGQTDDISELIPQSTVRFPEANSIPAGRISPARAKAGTWQDAGPYPDAIRRLLGYNNREDNALAEVLLSNGLVSYERPRGAKAISSTDPQNGSAVPHDQARFLFEAAISDNPVMQQQVYEVIRNLPQERIDDLVANIYLSESMRKAGEEFPTLSPQGQIAIEFIETGSANLTPERMREIAKAGGNFGTTKIQPAPDNPIPIVPQPTTQGGKGQFGRQQPGSNGRIEPAENDPNLHVPMRVGIDEAKRGEGILPDQDSIVRERAPGARIPGGLNGQLENPPARVKRLSPEVADRIASRDNMSEMDLMARQIQRLVNEGMPQSGPGDLNNIPADGGLQAGVGPRKDPSNKVEFDYDPAAAFKESRSSNSPVSSGKGDKTKASVVEQLYQMMQGRGDKNSAPVVYNADGTVTPRPGFETPEKFADRVLHLVRSNPTNVPTHVVRDLIADAANKRWYVPGNVRPATDAPAAPKGTSSDLPDLPEGMVLNTPGEIPAPVSATPAGAARSNAFLPDTSGLMSADRRIARGAAEELVNAYRRSALNMSQGVTDPTSVNELAAVAAFIEAEKPMAELSRLQRQMGKTEGGVSPEDFVARARELKPQLDEIFETYRVLDDPAFYEGLSDEARLSQMMAEQRRANPHFAVRDKSVDVPAELPSEEVVLSNVDREAFNRIFPNVDLDTPEGRDFYMRQAGYYRKPNPVEGEDPWGKSSFGFADESEEAQKAAKLRELQRRTAEQILKRTAPDGKEPNPRIYEMTLKAKARMDAEDAAGAAPQPASQGVTSPQQGLTPEQLAELNASLKVDPNADANAALDEAATTPKSAEPTETPAAKPAAEPTAKAEIEKRLSTNDEEGTGPLDDVPDQKVLDEAAKGKGKPKEPTNNELKATLRERGVKFPANANKAKLTELVEKSDPANAKAPEASTPDTSAEDSAVIKEKIGVETTPGADPQAIKQMRKDVEADQAAQADAGKTDKIDDLIPDDKAPAEGKAGKTEAPKAGKTDNVDDVIPEGKADEGPLDDVPEQDVLDKAASTKQSATGDDPDAARAVVDGDEGGKAELTEAEIEAMRKEWAEAEALSAAESAQARRGILSKAYDNTLRPIGGAIKRNPLKTAGTVGLGGALLAFLSRGRKPEGEKNPYSTVPPPGGQGSKTRPAGITPSDATAKQDPLEAFLQSMSQQERPAPPAYETVPAGGMPGGMAPGMAPGMPGGMPPGMPYDIIRQEQKRTRRYSPQTLQRYT